MGRRFSQAVPTAALLALAIGSGCGDDEPAPEFPPGHINPAGNFYVPVADEDQARELCDATDDWPEEYPQDVTFDLPHTGRDLTCVRP